MENEKIEQILAGITRQSANIQAAVLITRDGLPLVACLKDDVDPGTLGAVSASLLSLAKRNLQDMKKGILQQVIIQGSGGFILLVGVGENAVLSISSELDSGLGILLREVRKAAEQISRLI